ncbi:MAG TPA: LysM peptidoglycan-binding domain-containing protein [Firmicutes bacterium]|nr:LysM peptidoglycan-binding domain-containing protein [Bacillota bacterium]
MYFGIPNPNIIMPLEKMRITNLDCKNLKEASFEVLYNPQSYVHSRNVQYAQVPLMGADAPIIQFLFGSGEILSFELFFDSISAGAEVGGTAGDKLAFAGNSLLPSSTNLIDVREYTQKIFQLTHVDRDIHRPPELRVEWATLQFQGFLASCVQRFIKFDESGCPVRAMLQCTFVEHVDLGKLFGANPYGSPDTSEYQKVCQGDSLWAISAEKYGSCGQWREIAAANGLINPRKLRAGDTLVLPAVEH